MIYLPDELKLLEAIDEDKVERVDFDNDNIKAIAKETRVYTKEKQQISINLKKVDLDIIKQRAKNIWLSKTL